jgi:hypothetical protein
MRSFDAIVHELRRLRDSGSPIFAVHYACGNLYEIRDQPPAVSAIGFAEIGTDYAEVYSVIDRPQDGEKHVLESYFTFLQDHAGARFVHWNMNSSQFGFHSLASRYAHVCGKESPSYPAEDQRVDLDAVIKLGYGEDYADHPRLPSIADLNHLPRRYFLSGKEEAERLARGEHGGILRSLAEKVSLIAKLTRLVLDGRLETKHAGQRLEFAGSSLDSVQIIVALGERFRDVERQLKHRHDKRATLEVKDEYDAQDLIRTLLRVFFDDIRAEEWTPSYAGSASRIDFVLPRFGLAVELKHARKSLSTKELGEQLIVDIHKYQQDERVRHLVCLVFDHEGLFDNPRGIESDLSKPQGRLAVTVRIYDR